jgi:Flp pilus assembly protein TadD
MGILQSKKGLYANAIHALKEGLALDCDPARGNYYLGICFNQLDKIEEAERAFERVVAADPRFDRAWYQLGIVWDRKGDVDRAREMYRRARQVAARPRG